MRESILNIEGPIAGEDPMDALFGASTVSRKSVQAFLDTCDAPAVKVLINSPGGDVNEGFAIYNLLKNCGKHVTTEVVGMAASIASVVFCAGTDRRIAVGGRIMIHNSWASRASGESDDLRKLADTLDAMSDDIAAVYAATTGRDKEEFLRMMDEETWFNAAECLEYGFATEDALPASRYLPRAFKACALFKRNPFNPPEDMNTQSFLALAGLPEDSTEEGVKAHFLAINDKLKLIAELDAAKVALETEKAELTAKLETLGTEKAELTAKLEALQNSDTAAELARVTAELGDAKARIAEIDAIAKAEAEARAEAEAATFVDGLVAEGLVPVEKREQTLAHYKAAPKAVAEIFAMVPRGVSAPHIDGGQPRKPDMAVLAQAVRDAKTPAERAAAFKAFREAK